MSDSLKKMREPFPPNQISLLPKPTKKREEMDKLPKARCQECGGWHATSNVIHLSYVGHAALTDRLLDADPNWTWEPLSLRDGLPALDPVGGLWIKLTVGGVTRLGYGHAGDKEGGDAIKELIGDALRNAAMRFGAALELWHKGELHVEEDKSPAEVQIGIVKDHRTKVMQVRRSIMEHLAQEREMGALQEWQLAVALSENFAKDVWAGLPTPERKKITELQDKARAQEPA
jgi:hypothetical protein